MITDMYCLTCYPALFFRELASLTWVGFFFLFGTVYPPHSMDGEEFSWNVDDSTLSSFMSSYPRVPQHLRKRKETGGSRRRLVDQSELESDMTGVETSGVPETTAGNKTPLHVPNEDWEDNQPLAELGRARRRLTRGGARVGNTCERGPIPEVTLLNNLVRIWTPLFL